jgi:hypothetical protein
VPSAVGTLVPLTPFSAVPQSAVGSVVQVVAATPTVDVLLLENELVRMPVLEKLFEM